MPSSTAVHGHLQSWTASYMRYTHIFLDISHEEVDIRTYCIVHLKNHVETQDAELEKRAEMITDLEQRLLEI
jgi:hypothetical protein